MHRGYIKLYRKVTESVVFKNPHLWQLFSYCLVRANYKDGIIPIHVGRGISLVEVKRGEFLTGRQSLSHALGWTASSTRNRLEMLKKLQKVDIQPNSHYSIITIVNYSQYQCDEIEGDSQEDNQRTGKGQAKDSQQDTDKKYKKDKKDKKEDKSIPPKKGVVVYRENLFNKFWKAYPKKKSKGQAEKTWNKIKPDDQLLATMLSTIEISKTSSDWIKNSGQYVPFPSTWLNAEGWLDEFAVDVLPPEKDADLKRFYDKSKNNNGRFLE